MLKDHVTPVAARSTHLASRNLFAMNKLAGVVGLSIVVAVVIVGMPAAEEAILLNPNTAREACQPKEDKPIPVVGAILPASKLLTTIKQSSVCCTPPSTSVQLSHGDAQQSSGSSQHEVSPQISKLRRIIWAG